MRIPFLSLGECEKILHIICLATKQLHLFTNESKYILDFS